MPEVEPRLVRSERDANQRTRDCWDAYTLHRQRVTQLVCDAARGLPARSSLCVLGPGNLNDLDLGAVLRAFATIDLVDCDADAVQAGVNRQLTRTDIDARVRIHPPTDLSGVGLCDSTRTPSEMADMGRELIRRLAEASPLSGDNEALRRRRDSYAVLLRSQYDVVISTCVLSQLVRPIHEHFGRDNDIVQSVRRLVIDNHLKLVAALLKDNGHGLVVTDMAGSAAGAPEITAAAESDIEELGRCLIQERRYYSDLSPQELIDVTAGADLAQHIALARVTSFWRWRISDDVQYVCYALDFLQRSGAAAFETECSSIADIVRRFSARTGVTVLRHR